MGRAYRASAMVPNLFAAASLPGSTLPGIPGGIASAARSQGSTRHRTAEPSPYADDGALPQCQSAGAFRRWCRVAAVIPIGAGKRDRSVFAASGLLDSNAPIFLVAGSAYLVALIALHFTSPRLTPAVLPVTEILA